MRGGGADRLCPSAWDLSRPPAATGGKATGRMRHLSSLLSRELSACRAVLSRRPASTQAYRVRRIRHAAIASARRDGVLVLKFAINEY
jgi:hypothetical protein